MAEIETHKPISALPEESESLEGFYTVGYKEEDGEKVSKKVNLGFVQQAADSANEAASNANEKAGEAEQAKQDVLNAQETIEAAEQERASAETERQSSEQERQAAEQARSENETSRQTSETQRQESESARTEAEEARAEAEQERQEAETSRKQAERPYSRIDQVAGPMFDVTYPSLDYAYAKDYFENHAPQVNPAGCSALVKNGILVRSYDWKRKTADGKTICSFAVHTPAAQGHFAVVGMAGGLDALTEDVVEARQFSEAYKILPFCMQDGKNEKDLFAEMNVVPTWHNTRTVPAVEKRESISAIMLVRYILDNFQTVDEAVSYLQNYAEVYMPTNLDEMGYELHFLIADATKSVAIEFVDNAIVAIETDKLTNFHLSGVTLNEDGSVYTNADVADGNLPSSQGIEDYAGGLERFNILNAATDPVEAIKAVVFSKAYTDLVNVWFSEFVGGNLTVNTPADDADLLARIAEYRQKWEDQDNDVWISVHQSIYRFGVAGLDVAIREGSDEHFVPISDHAQAQSDHSLAENDHSTAQQDHAQSALDHAQAETDHANAVEATAACIEATEAIGANESARQQSELSRQTAEQARSNAESARQTAETERAQQAASDHTTAQGDHTQAGTDHTQAGQDHTTAQSDHSQATEDHNATVEAAEKCTEAKEAIEANESERQEAESSRNTAESARASAETSRESAESSRGTAETARQSNEQQRQTSETSRGTAETARQTAETSRGEAEQSRQSAESARDTAEQAREAAEILRNNAISGVNDLPLFSPEERYLAGKYVLHTAQDGKLYVYRFEITHEAGEWNDNEVTQTSVFGELTNLVVGDVEKIHINVSSSDGGVDVEGLEVSLAIEGGTTTILECDEDGNCEAEVPKNTVYTVSVADRTGYQHVASYKTRANSNLKYIYLVYEQTISGDTCTVTVRLIQNGGRAEAASSFGGKTVNLMLSNQTSRSAVTDSNGVATFLNVTKGLEVRTANPKVTGFVTPASSSFVTNFDTIGIDLTYYAMTAPGIWMVRDDGEEFDYENWDTSDTCVAIHIATQALVEEGKDYYVRIDDLTNTWFTSAHNKQWATSNVNFPNVPNYNASSPYYDGNAATQAMISDAATLNINSPAAEFVVEERFTLRGNTAQGYIGTRDQWQPIVDNKDMIALMYTLIGKSATWNGKNIWTSSQNSATSAWYWGSGSWDSSVKYNSGAVVPFFAI